MKIQRKKRILVLFLLLACTGLVHGSFENNFYSPRIKGMGSAFVAVADDYYTSLINPAGLAGLDKIGVSFSYAMPYMGFDEDFKLNNYFVSLVYPNLKAGNFNFYFSRFSVSQLYAENIYSLDYGVSINNFWKKLAFKFNAGLGLKLLEKSFTLDNRTQNDPVFRDNTSKTAFGMDLGILLSSFKNGSAHYYTIGLSIRDLNEPDTGLASPDVVYRKYQLGFAYNWVDLKLLHGSMITPAFEFNYCHGESQILLGLEMWVYRKLLGFRGGWNSNEVSAGLSFNYKIKNKYEVDFDYSFILARQLVQNYGTHNFALTFKFLDLRI